LENDTIVHLPTQCSSDWYGIIPSRERTCFSILFLITNEKPQNEETNVTAKAEARQMERSQQNKKEE